MDKFRDDLRVGLALKLISAFLEESFDVLVVRDDSVMYYDESVFDIRPLGVRVEFTRRTVSCPTRVRNAAMCFNDGIQVVSNHLLGNCIFKDLHFSSLLD